MNDWVEADHKFEVDDVGKAEMVEPSEPQKVRE